MAKTNKSRQFLDCRLAQKVIMNDLLNLDEAYCRRSLQTAADHNSTSLHASNNSILANSQTVPLKSNLIKSMNNSSKNKSLKSSQFPTTPVNEPIAPTFSIPSQTLPSNNASKNKVTTCKVLNNSQNRFNSITRTSSISPQISLSGNLSSNHPTTVLTPIKPKTASIRTSFQNNYIHNTPIVQMSLPRNATFNDTDSRHALSKSITSSRRTLSTKNSSCTSVITTDHVPPSSNTSLPRNNTSLLPTSSKPTTSSSPSSENIPAYIPTSSPSNKISLTRQNRTIIPNQHRTSVDSRTSRVILTEPENEAQSTAALLM